MNIYEEDIVEKYIMNDAISDAEEGFMIGYLAAQVIKMFKKQTKYMKWDDYKAKIDFLDFFWWQQSVRRRNIKNLGGC